MSLTYKNAKNEMLDKFKAKWDTTGYPVSYEDVRKVRDKDEHAWANVFIRHTTGGQRAFGGSNQRTFSRSGTITVQLFTPSGKGLQEAYDLAKVVSDAFEGIATPGGVWFRNVRLNEVGRDGEFFQLNVVVEFVYDEIK